MSLRNLPVLPYRNSALIRRRFSFSSHTHSSLLSFVLQLLVNSPCSRRFGFALAAMALTQASLDIRRVELSYVPKTPISSRMEGWILTDTVYSFQTQYIVIIALSGWYEPLHMQSCVDDRSNERIGILIYDYCLNFSKEVNWIWRAPRKTALTIVLYVLNRYLSILAIPVIMLKYFWQNPDPGRLDVSDWFHSVHCLATLFANRDRLGVRDSDRSHGAIEAEAHASAAACI